MNAHDTELSNRHNESVLKEFIGEHTQNINSLINEANESGYNYLNYDLPDIFVNLEINFTRADLQILLYHSLITHFEGLGFIVSILKKKQKNGDTNSILKIEWKPLFTRAEMKAMEDIVIRHTQEI